LTNVSFITRPDEITALVGATGSGKSTVAALAARLYDPDRGRVLLDGHDVKDLSLESLSRHVGLVTQDSHMFHDTIEANLRYADPNASELQLREACARAQILDFIEALPDGMNTVVGERGFMFSGGVRQRLAIARVLLKDPKVLILDEATSHLDSITEERLLAAMREVFKDRTVLVIAHRIATTRAAHKVLVFDAGRVIEEGSHDDLWRADGTYRSLCERQVLS
jgi:ATP-binding cassette subfamily B protein